MALAQILYSMVQEQNLNNNRVGRMKMKKAKTFLLDYAPILAIIGAIIITIYLSFADRIPNEKAMNYLLCADAGLAITTFYALLKNEKSVSTLKTQLEVHSLSKKVTRRESYQLLEKAIIGVKAEIRIMTIDANLNQRNMRSFPERDAYYSRIKKAAKQKEIIIYRIYGLQADETSRKDRIAWIKKDLDAIKNCPNYHIAIFDWRKFNSIMTPISLQIVDDTFINLVDITRSDGVVGSGEDICSKDQNIVQHFTHYYENIWDKCDKLKIGDQIFLDVLTE